MAGSSSLCPGIPAALLEACLQTVACLPAPQPQITGDIRASVCLSPCLSYMQVDPLSLVDSD